jgi:hypothetical protein
VEHESVLDRLTPKQPVQNGFVFHAPADRFMAVGRKRIVARVTPDQVTAHR